MKKVIEGLEPVNLGAEARASLDQLATQSSIVSPNDPFVMKGQQIKIFDGFKYHGFSVGSTECDFKIRIGLF